jgi:hypothetical protein
MACLTGCSFVVERYLVLCICLGRLCGYGVAVRNRAKPGSAPRQFTYSRAVTTTFILVIADKQSCRRRRNTNIV